MGVKHGMSGTRFYNVWKGMKKRCDDSFSKPYKYYGAKGVLVCERWRDFNNFKDDMFDSYVEHMDVYGKDTSIERTNVYGDYSPENCRWATMKEQSKNKRKKEKVLNNKSGGGEMIEGKGLGNKKVNRVGVSLSNDYSLKLNRLATSCGMKPTTLAGLILERGLDDPKLVRVLQKEFCKYAAYRVLPIKNYETGEVEYSLNNNERDDFK